MPLDAAGCFKIFAEKKSGTRRDGRTELAVLLEIVREGETVIVTRIDRLARSVRDLQNIVHELREKGVALKATFVNILEPGCYRRRLRRSNAEMDADGVGQVTLTQERDHRAPRNVRARRS